MTTATRPAINWATKEQRAEGHVHIEGVKCELCVSTDSPMFWQPFGGATTYAEAEAFVKAQEIQWAADEQVWMFEDLSRNVWQSEMEPAEKAAAIEALAGELRTRLSQAVTQGEAAVTQDPGFFKAFRDKAGDLRWITIHSNKYRDREGEIFSEKAHRDYVDWAMETGQLPWLRLFHVEGTDIGRADVIGYDDAGFVIASGKFFDDPDSLAVAEKLLQMEGLGCSHGYWYPTGALRDGIYHEYKSYEISILPVEHAANLLTTAFFAGEEIPMLDARAKEFLTQVMPDGRVEKIEQSVRALADVAESKGLSYKALAGELIGAKDEPAAVADPPAPEAAAAEGGEVTPAGAPDGEAAAPDAEAHAEVEQAAADEPQEPAETTEPPVAEQAPAGLATVQEDEEPEPGDAPTPTAEEQAIAAAAMEQAGPLVGGKALADLLMSTVQEVVQPLIDANKALEEKVTALQRTDDEKMADRIRPRVGPVEAGHSASRGRGNLLDGAASAKAEAEHKVEVEPGEANQGPVTPASKFTNMLGRIPMGAQ